MYIVGMWQLSDEFNKMNTKLLTFRDLKRRKGEGEGTSAVVVGGGICSVLLARLWEVIECTQSHISRTKSYGKSDVSMHVNHSVK